MSTWDSALGIFLIDLLRTTLTTLMVNLVGSRQRARCRDQIRLCGGNTTRGRLEDAFQVHPRIAHHFAVCDNCP
jgi:hypothetical protein